MFHIVNVYKGCILHIFGQYKSKNEKKSPKKVDKCTYKTDNITVRMSNGMTWFNLGLLGAKIMLN